jgi:hypothetical protein
LISHVTYNLGSCSDVGTKQAIGHVMMAGASRDVAVALPMPAVVETHRASAPGAGVVAPTDGAVALPTQAVDPAIDTVVSVIVTFSHNESFHPDAFLCAFTQEFRSRTK